LQYLDERPQRQHDNDAIARPACAQQHFPRSRSVIVLAVAPGHACAAKPAPPISTSLSVASSAAATFSATDASASRALPWTLSSVRLKTTFGIAH
jgi:hypothetical protein